MADLSTLNTGSYVLNAEKNIMIRKTHEELCHIARQADEKLLMRLRGR